MAEKTIAEPPYVEQLTEGLKRELEGADVTHERLRADRYRFVVYWPGFNDVDQDDRQHKVWEIAERSLDRGNLIKVSMILALGPDDFLNE